jgi:hypothetical protein
LGVPEYIAALTGVKGAVAQFRRFAAHLRGSDSLRRLLAVVTEIERLAQEIDSAKELEGAAASLMETARTIPPGPERHDVLKQIGKLHIKLDAVVSAQKKLRPSAGGRGHVPSDHYIVTFQTDFAGRSWYWEIRRHREPMDILATEGGYRTRTAAEVAGKRALAEFLDMLAEKAKRPR